MILPWTTLANVSALWVCFLVSQSALGAERVDLVIEKGTIHDGSGTSIGVGYVAIREGVIIAVGTGAGPAAEQRIDATGLVVCPGFIDLHTHSDRGLTKPATRAAVNYLMQGCTTSVTGNCGMGPIEVQKFYDDVDLAGAGTNVAHLLPQGSLRSHVVGSVDRKATAAELQEMQRIAQKAMEDGAWGMSTGLIYTPSTYADTQELIEIAKVIGREGGIYASHIRGEEQQLLSSVEEALTIGVEADVPVHISHFKAKGTPNWGTLRVAAAMVEKARETGQRVTADQYPYIAASTSLVATIFPPWSVSGGTEKLVERLDDPETGGKIRESVASSLKIKEDGKQIVIAVYPPRPEWVGKSMNEIAASEGKTALQIAEEIVRKGGAKIVNFAMNEEEVRMAMRHPWVATASDGSVMLPDATRPHPRSYGTFARKIGYYAIREKVIPLEQAIRSSTGLPADILHLTDRGYLKPGLAADIVVFDPKSIIDTATFEDPHQYAVGMRYVFVNGVAAVFEGSPTGALAGQALRKHAIESN